LFKSETLASSFDTVRRKQSEFYQSDKLQRLVITPCDIKS
jgi:hypothetical protein